MGSLHVLKGLGEAIEKANDKAVERIRRANRNLYDALKLQELDHTQRSMLNECLEGIQVPNDVDDQAVIAALADPNRDFLAEYQLTPFRYRHRWHALLSIVFRLRTDAHEQEEAVKRRLGLIRLALKIK